jgi:ABC-type dipeptide/oligopeptide/nickel transport system permease component
MRRFLLARLIQGIIVLIGASLLVFVLVRLSGNPVYLLLPMEASQEDVARVTRELGLDKPIYEQYAIYLSNMVRGDFGMSIRYKRPVMELLGYRLLNSVKLGGISLIVAVLIAFPLGIVAAVRRGGVLDALARGLAIFGQSVPSFWLGLGLLVVFSGWLKILPAGRMEGASSYVLPVITLSLTGFLLSGMVRFLRSGMLEVLDSEYIKLARAKGQPERIVIWKHALKNAAIPMVTFLGFYVTMLIGGASLVVETVFAWPGVGTLLYSAIMSRDFPVVQAVTLIIMAAFAVVNMGIDILYAYLDPRIRY